MAHQGSKKKIENVTEYKPNTNQVVMEEKSNIDKLFEDSLNQQTFDIPEDFLQDLNKRLDALQEKKKRRFFWWFFFFGGIGLALTVVILTPKSPVENSKISYTQKETTASEKPFSIKENEKKSSGNSRAKTTQFTTADQVKEHPETEENNFSTAQLSKNQINNVESEKSSKKIATESFKNTRSEQPNESFKEELVSTINSKSERNAKENVEDSKENNSVQPTEKIENDTISSSEVAKVDSTTTIKTEKNDQIPLESITSQNKSKWEKEVQLYFGFGKNLFHDSYSPDSIRNLSSPISPTFGINVNLTKNKFSYSAGFSFNQVSEKFNSSKLKTYSKDTVIIEDILTADTIWFYNDTTETWEIESITQYVDTAHVYTTVSETLVDNRQFRNLYSWISIPLSFGYRFELGKYAITPRVGLQFNFGIRNSGYYPTLESEILIAPVKFNLSYQLQLELRRSFKKWHIFLNPYFRSMFTPAVKQENLIRRKYSTYGLQLGVGFKL